MSDRTSAADYDADMQRAKAMGIDAFALNIGTDDYNDLQLGFAYQSAANNDMKVFISFDFAWYNADSSAAVVGQKIAAYASKAGQLKVGDKTVASSFVGEHLNVQAMRAAAGNVAVYWAPNYYPNSVDVSTVDAALSWIAWPNNGANAAPTADHNYTVEYDDSLYTQWLNGKPYVARKFPSPRAAVAFDTDDPQPCRLGSAPTMAPKSHTARTGYFPAISSGSTGGRASSPQSLSSWRLSAGTTTASRIMSVPWPRSTPTTEAPSGSTTCHTTGGWTWRNPSSPLTRPASRRPRTT